MIITSTHYNRPQATASMLNHLVECWGIEDYTLIAQVEPGFPEVITELEKYPHKIEININDNLKGCWVNKKLAIKRGFELSDRVIHIEDDVIVSPDTLKLFEFFERYKDDKDIFSCTAFSLDRRYESIEWVIRGKGYSSLAFSLWRDRWEKLLDDGWNGSDTFIENNYTEYYHMHPLISRAKHLIFDGIGSNKEIFDIIAEKKHIPFGYANDDDIDKEEYIKALEKSKENELDIDVINAIDNRIKVVKNQNFDTQLIINSKMHEWSKLDDNHVKTKNPEEYKYYELDKWALDYRIDGVFYEKKL